jgi:hypothetical protein
VFDAQGPARDIGRTGLDRTFRVRCSGSDAQG